MALIGYTDGSPTNGANPWIDALVYGTGRWIDADGGITTIGYAHVSSEVNIYYPTIVTVNWQSYEIAAFANAIGAWEAVANIDFIQMAANDADVWVYLHPSFTSPSGEVAGTSSVPYLPPGSPNSSYDPSMPGTISFSADIPSWQGEYNFLPGAFSYSVMIHEIGHQLGLAHPHDGTTYAVPGNKFPGVTSDQDLGTYNLNQGIWTVMSYNFGWETEFPYFNTTYGSPVTPMAFDIAAIQAIYGANMSYRTGNDIYTLPTANASGTGWACIWDAGGIDTITAGATNAPSIINLNAAALTGPYAGGVVSRVIGIVGGFTIANGVTIENATGGAGNDTLIGNEVANRLEGGGGDDALFGGNGADTLIGGAGTDIANYSGDAGAGGTHGAYVDLSTGFGMDGFGSYDSLSGIEAVIGTDGGYGGGPSGDANLSDVMVGNDAANRFEGRGGLDYILAGGGNDTVIAGSGNDIVFGGAGNDSLQGDAGADFIFGEDGSDTLIGGDGNDWLIGANWAGPSTGVDLAYGGAGDDVIAVGNAALTTSTLQAYGEAGADIIYGGAGNDYLSGGAGSDYIWGAGGADVFRFEAADLVAGDVDTILMGVGEGDVLSFAANLSGGIAISAGIAGGVAGVYLAAAVSGGYWVGWLPSQSVASVQAAIVYM